MSPAEEFTAERVLKCIASLAVKHNKPTLSENAWNYAMVQVMIDQDGNGEDVLNAPESWWKEMNIKRVLWMLVHS